MAKVTKNKKLICILSSLFILIFSIWGAVAPLLVYALPPALLKIRTIGELIVSIFAASGTALSNPTVVPAIYSAYDTEAFSLETLVTEGILQPVDSSVTVEQAIESLGTGNKTSSPYNLDANAFRTYVQDNWSQMEQYGIDAALRLDNIANTDSVYGAIDNLGQLVLDVANYGYLGASNAIAVVTNPGTVVEVGLQNILDSIKNVYAPYINTNAPIQVRNIVGNTSGYSTRSPGYPYSISYVEVPEGVATGFVMTSSNLRLYYRPISGNRESVKVYSQLNKYPTMEGTLNVQTVNLASNQTNFMSFSLSNAPSYLNYYWGCPVFNSESDFQAYCQNIIDGNEERNLGYNPNFINQDQGNVTGEEGINPYLEEGQGLAIIPSDAYDGFMQDANNNPGPENGAYFDEFINPYVVDNYMQEDWENPVIPGTNPINPAQPTLAPKPTVAPENLEDIMIPVTPDLSQVFPFCIPWDLLAFARGFKSERRAPSFEWRFYIPDFGIDYTFEVDLSGFDEVARILRTMELVVFIIGLAVATRKLIGA